MKRVALTIMAAAALTGCNAYGDGMGNILRGTGIAAPEADYDVPYVPTPEPVVDAMLDIADVRRGDMLIDLGSGDGRIAIAAARRGANASGVEIDPALVERARRNAALLGLEEQARFSRANLFDIPLRDASVVTLYLLPRINLALRPRLLTEAKPGTRIVAHAFDMGDWRPDAERLVGDRRIYLWIVPGVAGGEWRVTMADGRTAMLTLDQRFQDVTGTMDGVAVTGGLRGTALRLVAGGRVLTGAIGDDGITGEGWRAVRTS
ncbi:class I SAM-dependent methyltransferase [Sphingomonas sp. CFBP 13720]|uniref:class I SAM-dependent methyltransferase n=1 Tax=Sphingomonas sp. CFBP 13720 TaxID=2775302 RepID=UPI001786BA2C|nr:methyltransferase domain-containing protein [Sphingomonas sp. CFBP 13720]MBD8678058.1 class I SAM-dependent methyltransferase [Sphingomonas sp. CFBP 13720]